MLEFFAEEAEEPEHVAKDEKVRAAGLILRTPDDSALFLKRSDKDGQDHPGEWCWPGGQLEGDEEPLDAALREAREETSWVDEDKKKPEQVDEGGGDVEFTTFRIDVNNPFIPTLDDEHVGWAWAPLESPPEPLHPGVRATLEKFADEEQAQDDGGFKEADHPRKDDGKFGSGSSARTESKSSGHQATKIVDGKRVTTSGGVLPSHIQALKIPPAWTDVTYSSDPESALQATGRDSKGRRQAIYSSKFAATQAAAKFARISDLNKKFNDIKAQNAEAQMSSDSKTQDSADCLDLVMKMGVRPGSESDTGAKVKAYGATTLEGKHVVVDGDRVSLKFVGKKGVVLDLPVTDPALATSLRRRAKKAGADGKLFPATSHAALLEHVHTLNGGGFKTKDFRTHLGTSTAADLVAKRPVPKNEKEYKKAVMDVAKHVSKLLGNTPTIALQSYISPVVFAQWRIAA